MVRPHDAQASTSDEAVVWNASKEIVVGLFLIKLVVESWSCEGHIAAAKLALQEQFLQILENFQ